MERNFIDGYTEWQSNPEIVGVNRLPQHATLMPYENIEEAKKADRYASSRCKLLNGKWKFKLYKKTMRTNHRILQTQTTIHTIGIL